MNDYCDYCNRILDDPEEKELGICDYCSQPESDRTCIEFELTKLLKLSPQNA